MLRWPSRLPSGLAMLAAAMCVIAAADSGLAQTSEVQDKSRLRVCADPANLPFSNKAGEGFENKIAELLAEKLKVPVRYTWFPQGVGFVRNTLNARKCDLVIGISLGFELLQNTNPYYTSTYALIYRADSGLTAGSLKDPSLKGRSIGVVAGTPPATLLARNGLLDKMRPYHLMVDTRFDSPGKDMAEDVAKGDVDVGLLWGPIAGYYAQQQDPPLTVVPLLSAEEGMRMDYTITMGLRFNEPLWKREMNRLIRKNKDAINAILFDYGVPLLDRKGKVMARPAEPETKDQSATGDQPATTQTAALVPEPAGYRMKAFRAPVPATLAGATVVDTAAVKALVESGDVVLVDVLPRPPRPEGLPEDTIWRPRPRNNLPDTAWLANTGFGALAPKVEDYFKQNLDSLTEGDKARKLVIYCQANCWMSWNAAKRAVAYGYSAVYWYPDGTDGWSAAGLPLEKSEPVPLDGTAN